MTILTPRQVSAYMQRAGFSGEGLQYGLTVVVRESGNNTLAINYADPHGGSFGLWQINGAHIVELGGSEITLAQAYDPQQSSNWAFFASKRGTSFYPTWSTARDFPYPYGPVGSPTSVVQKPPVISSGGGGGGGGTPKQVLPPLQLPNYQPTPGYTPPSSIGLVGSAADNPATYTDTGSGFSYILAYTVAIALFVLISKTKIGYIAIYYSLSLCLIFLLVTQSQFIANALKPLEPVTPTTTQTPVTV